nr:MAG TPA: hypothetical protein [Caudoviricetes sp.]
MICSFFIIQAASSQKSHILHQSVNSNIIILYNDQEQIYR